MKTLKLKDILNESNLKINNKYEILNSRNNDSYSSGDIFRVVDIDSKYYVIQSWGHKEKRYSKSMKVNKKEFDRMMFGEL